MNTVRTLAGWLLFLAMAFLAGFFWHQSVSRGNYIDTLSGTISEMSEQIDQLSTALSSLEKQVEQESEATELLRAENEAMESGTALSPNADSTATNGE